MRYFGYIAEQSFKTAPDGRRLFYRGGPWSRPYLVPDAETEQRLFKKQLWMMRVLLGGMIIGQPFLLLLVPDVTTKPLWFLGYMAIDLIVFWFVGSIVFRNELANLSRVESRVPLHDFYSGTAAQHTTGKLLLLILGAVAFVAAGYWMVASGRNVFVGWLAIVFFGLCAVAGVYALSLKLKEQ
jgi:hypothetical protein